MSRTNLKTAWLLLLLVPATAFAQSRTVDRSRDRETTVRVVEKQRSVKRSSEDKSTKSRDRVRVREDKVSSTKKSTKQRSDAKRKRSDNEKKRATRPTPGPTKTHNRGDRDSKRKYERKGDRKNTSHRRAQHPNVPKRHTARRPKHTPRVVHRSHRKPHVFKHRVPSRRYVYRPRRYYRHRHTGFGFYIRIPFVRWHVGHTRRFAYRQVVVGRRGGQVEIVSTLKRRVRNVQRDYVEVEFELDRIELLAGGQFRGEVDRFPGNMRKVRAKIYRDGYVEFDRMLYVVGNERTGYEMFSTRYCGGELAGASYECLDPRVGEVDFYDERVHSVGGSRLLDLVYRGQIVPVSLIPDEEYLGFQYAVGGSASNDGYYSGTYDYSSLNRIGNDGRAYRLSASAEASGFETAGVGVPDFADGEGFAHESVVSYATPEGSTVELQRQAQIEYLDD